MPVNNTVHRISMLSIFVMLTSANMSIKSHKSPLPVGWLRQLTGIWLWGLKCRHCLGGPTQKKQLNITSDRLHCL